MLSQAVASGDVAAARHVLTVAAAFKSLSPPVSVPGFAEATTATERLDLVLDAATSGQISVEQARDLVAVVQARHALETESDVELRLAELERRHQRGWAA